MSTKIPDTIMGLQELKSTDQPTPIDVGGVIFMPSDYISSKSYCGFGLAGCVGSGTGKLSFCDFFDGENIVGEMEFSNSGFLISFVDFSEATPDENGFACVSFKLSFTGSGLAIVALAGIKVY